MNEYNTELVAKMAFITTNYAIPVEVICVYYYLSKRHSRSGREIILLNRASL